MTAEQKNILIYRPGQLGDTLVSLPALAAIAKRHLGARLTLLTDAHPGKGFVSSWEVLGPTGLFSDVLFYEPGLGPRALWRLASRIRKLKAERLYYLAPTPRTRSQVRRDRLFFQTLCGIQDAVGLAATAPGPGRLPAEAARLLAVVGAPSDAPSVSVPVAEAQKLRVDGLWREANLGESRVIALGPGGNTAAARWPIERYEALTRRLRAHATDIRLVVLGSRQDSQAARRLPDAVDWTGLGVLESAEALRRCALFVGNNSGLMHLAAEMGTRCVVISSGRDSPGMWDPRGEGHVVLYKNVACGGCRLSVCTDHDLICLTSICVDEAAQACAAALSDTLCRPYPG